MLSRAILELLVDSDTLRPSRQCKLESHLRRHMVQRLCDDPFSRDLMKSRKLVQAECLLLPPAERIEERLVDRGFTVPVGEHVREKGQRSHSPRIDVYPVLQRWRPVFRPDVIFATTVH